MVLAQMVKRQKSDHFLRISSILRIDGGPPGIAIRSCSLSMIRSASARITHTHTHAEADTQQNNRVQKISQSARKIQSIATTKRSNFCLAQSARLEVELSTYFPGFTCIQVRVMITASCIGQRDNEL